MKVSIPDVSSSPYFTCVRCEFYARKGSGIVHHQYDRQPDLPGPLGAEVQGTREFCPRLQTCGVLLRVQSTR